VEEATEGFGLETERWPSWRGGIRDVVSNLGRKARPAGVTLDHDGAAIVGPAGAASLTFAGGAVGADG